MKKSNYYSKEAAKILTALTFICTLLVFAMITLEKGTTINPYAILDRSLRNSPPEDIFVCDIEEYMPQTFAGCFGDVDGNGMVSPADAGYVSANIGRENNILICVFDLNGDGVVNFEDRREIMTNVGFCESLPDYQDGSGLNEGLPDARFPLP